LSRDETATTDIEFANIQRFPQPRAQTIGLRGELRYYEAEPTPGPGCPQPPTLPATRISIGPQLQPSRDRELPPPGAYDPAEMRPSRSVMPMERAMGRSELWASTVTSPGPGTYDIVPSLNPPKKWTDRLRGVRPLPVKQLKRSGVLRLRMHKSSSLGRFFDRT
jgi:hypothetical protein